MKKDQGENGTITNKINPTVSYQQNKPADKQQP